MKSRISHGLAKDPKPESGMWMMAEEMNPDSLLLREGQEFTAYEYDPDTKGKRKRHIKLIKLYRHHALCMVNGRHMECFTYSELYTMKVAVCDKERIYNELPEEQKQAFDHCLDLGQVKEAREILVEHERSKRNESDHEISREQVVPGKLDHQTLP